MPDEIRRENIFREKKEMPVMAFCQGDVSKGVEEGSRPDAVERERRPV
jgi:hypothetical protein